jgi:hypothetical protein
MKNPVRYFVDEGFLSIYYWKNQNEFGKLHGRAFYHPDIKIGGDDMGHAVFNNTKYVVDNDFFMDYGTYVEDEDEAKKIGIAWQLARGEVDTQFACNYKEIQKLNAD